MEALIEIEQPETEETEKLLIFENLQEIQKIRQEVESRLSLLNNISRHGLTADQIKTVTTSKATIDDFIFQEQLKINDELRKQFEAGKKNLKDEYELPKNLQDLKYALLAWHSYSPPDGRYGDKFKDLILTDSWSVNQSRLENYFVAKNWKFYLQTNEEISEYNFLKSWCFYFEKMKAPNNQIAGNSFFRDRIICVSAHKFEPNYRYFMNKRERL